LACNDIEVVVMRVQSACLRLAAKIEKMTRNFPSGLVMMMAAGIVQLMKILYHVTYIPIDSVGFSYATQEEYDMEMYIEAYEDESIIAICDIYLLLHIYK
jgi:hypothetical protein